MLTGVLIVAAGMVVIAALAQLRGRVSMPVTPIASAPDATLVRIRGRVSCDQPLVAPFSGRSCVFYRVELHTIQFGRRDTFAIDDACPFTVTDDTGTARIARERAHWEVPASDGEQTRASRLSERAQALVANQRWQLPEIAGVQLTEAVIAIDDIVDIAGTPARELQPDAAGERGFRDAPTQLVFTGDIYVRYQGRAR